MRTLLFLLFVSTPAFACPDLAGTFEKCESLRAGASPGVKQMRIAQDGISYTFSSVTADGRESATTYVADGSEQVTETKVGDGPASRTVSVATCEGSALLVASDVAIAQLGLTLKITQRVSRTPAGDLQVDVSLNGSAPAMVICRKQ